LSFGRASLYKKRQVFTAHGCMIYISVSFQIFY